MLCDAPILALLEGQGDFVVCCGASNQERAEYTLETMDRIFSDNGCEIRYHPSKANVVADALSRKEWMKSRRVRAMSMTIHSSIKARILEAQSEASKTPKTLGIASTARDSQVEMREDHMDIITKLPRTSSGHDSIWVIKALGTQVDISTDYHPQTDERTIQTLKDMLRACAIDLNCDTHLPLVNSRTTIGIHDTFHVSNLKKCLVYVNLHVPLEEIKIDNERRFVKEPIEIMNREVKKLKQSRIPIVKVHWNSQRGLEFTWEREDEMKRKYPRLFASATT
nr:putative reverse transcriptase domain-containing protein [Tanacetum cinerariifolium]